MQFGAARKAWWMLVDGGGDVVAMCDLSGTSGTARVFTQIVYDVYGRVIGRDDPHHPITPPPLREARRNCGSVTRGCSLTDWMAASPTR
ncbi:MAG: hypothetical protein KF864_00030 [Phycisphaeraceae bacterium]|nr:hypothetical protein [Phycisphaeraceae bacterium]